MTPAEAQQAALDQLEHLGGKPVVLQAKEQLSNQAKISLASSTQPAHVLSYHPAFVHELPYLVCFQCVMAERTLKAAADERFNVASTPGTYQRVQKLVGKKPPTFSAGRRLGSCCDRVGSWPKRRSATTQMS